ncbi:MAG TPA: cytochrome c3 family protein [Solimonas sp.]|nr:cytochrome c3 family protein [Solimonas sp.]
MRCLVRTLVKNARQDVSLEADALSLGRSSQNLVELPGLLVSPLHARIVLDTRGGWRVQSSALAGVDVNEVVGIRDGEVRVGDVLGIGEHRIRMLDPPAGYDLAVEVEIGDPGSAFARSGSRTELLAAGMRQRSPALVLFALILLGGLLVPMIALLAGSDVLAPIARWADTLWLTRPVSPPHAHFGQDCARCHQQAFVRVQDSTCLSCHVEVKHHSDAAAIREVEGFQHRCASCHDEHAGRQNLIVRNAELCTDCHARPQFAQFPDLTPAADFGQSHPVFRPRVTQARADGGREQKKVAQTPQLKDYGALLYPHDLHLAKAGVRSTAGTELLQCRNCHEPAVGGVGFSDIRFEPHCARCHRLDAVAGERVVTLPHGSNAAVWGVLEQLGSGEGVADYVEPERRLPGDAAPRGGAKTLEQQLADVFERRVCAKCHEVERDAQTQRPQVRPVKLPHRWFTNATFTHAEHVSVDCESCHKARAAKSSEVLMLPDLEGCRSCHGGVASKDKVQSTCIDCHRLHRGTQPWLADVGGLGQADAAQKKKEVRDPLPVQ